MSLWAEDLARGALVENKIRFHITDSENRRRSAFWFVAGSNNSVYVSSASVGGQIKLSFHPRGTSNDGNDSQYGLTRRYYDKLSKSVGLENTPFFRWQRPEANDKQLTQIASILYPTNFLAGEFEGAGEGKRRVALDMAPVDQAVEVSLFCSNEKEFCEALLMKAGLKPIVYFELTGPEYISLAARHVPFPLTFEAQLDRSGKANWLDGAPKPGGNAGNLSAIMLHDNPIDHRSVILAEANGIDVQRGRPK